MESLDWDWDGAMDMRDPPSGREGGFFIAEDGTGMDEWGRALPRGPSEARVRRRESMVDENDRVERPMEVARWVDQWNAAERRCGGRRRCTGIGCGREPAACRALARAEQMERIWIGRERPSSKEKTIACLHVY